MKKRCKRKEENCIKKQYYSPDSTIRCFQALVDFMYTGAIKLDQQSVQETLVAADMIQLKEVNKVKLSNGTK